VLKCTLEDMDASVERWPILVDRGGDFGDDVQLGNSCFTCLVLAVSVATSWTTRHCDVVVSSGNGKKLSVRGERIEGAENSRRHLFCRCCGS
jgi:hypothetical protein